MFGLFDSQEEKEKKARLERLFAIPQDEKLRSPPPIGNKVYPQEGIYNFQVIQDDKPITLHTYCHPATKPKAVCIIFHGLNTHVGKSAHIAAAMAEIGVTVVGFDFRGFGKSEGVRGLFESEQTHESDIEKFEEIVRKNYPNLPVFLSGLSWGGQTAFTCALKNPDKYKGLILYAPAIKDNDANAKFGKMFAKVLGFVAPRMQTVALKGGLASKNPQVDEDFYKDPYTYKGKVIPGTIRNLLNHQEYCSTVYEKLTTPFVVVMGGVDKLVDPDIGHELIRRSPAKDKELFFYEHLWHNIWAEPEITEILPRVIQWLQKRI